MLGLKKVFSFGQKNNKEKPTKENITEERKLSPFEEEMLRRAAAQKAQQDTHDTQEQKEEALTKAQISEKNLPLEKDLSKADTHNELDNQSASKHEEETSKASPLVEEPAPKVQASKAQTASHKNKQNKKDIKTAKQPVQETAPLVEKVSVDTPVEKTSALINTDASSTQNEEDKNSATKAVKTQKIEFEEEALSTSTPIAKKVTVHEHVAEKQEIVEVEENIEPKKQPWIQRLRMGLLRSSKQLGESIGSIFTKRKLDEETLQDLEDVLIQADLGVETAMRITDALASGRYGKDIAPDEVRKIMGTEINKVLEPVAKPLELDLSHKPHVILVVGVNGTGKTTTIGKLAAKLTAGGLKVMLAAGDTFRAAAIEQLHIWGKRTNSHVVSTKLGADAASLAYDAYEKAKNEGADVLIIDTAGRLQNKTELMDELAKIVRVLGKHDPDAPHTVLQTLDATTGQNALNQVEIFRNIAGVNGLVMTKLDGTARGGILVAIAAKHKLPVYFIGVGEGIDDLEPFKASDFAEAIAGFH